MNDDVLISRIAPLSDADAAAMISGQAARELAEQIMQTDPAGRPGPARHRRHPLRMVPVAAAITAAATVVAVMVALARPVPAVRPPRGNSWPPAHLEAVTSPAALAANATLAADRTIDPRPTQWIYLMVISTISHAPPGGAMAQIPGTRQTTGTWTRADRRQTAFLTNGRIVMMSTDILGSPIGWPQITYSYLNSLPTDPDRLMNVIKDNVQAIPGDDPTGQRVFNAVVALIENNPALPARLSAALYGVLAELNSVHLGHATDLAGQRVLSLSEVQQGYLKQEIFINPATYAYTGQETLAIRDHTSTGLDGTLHIHQGELLADNAIVASAIVDHPGER